MHIYRNVLRDWGRDKEIMKKMQNCDVVVVKAF